MSWHSSGPGQRHVFHHGNLRESLIEAPFGLICEKGLGGRSAA
jgi:hypothetical protein